MLQLKKQFFVCCLLCCAIKVSAQYSIGNTGLLNIPTADMLQKTEQTVTAKTAMLLQFRRGKVNVFFLNYHLLR